MDSTNTIPLDQQGKTCCSNVKLLKFPVLRSRRKNCSSRHRITLTLSIAVQFRSFPKLSKTYFQNTFGHQTNIKTNSTRRGRKEAPGSCLRGASFECQSRMTQYTCREQSQEIAHYKDIYIYTHTFLYLHMCYMCHMSCRRYVIVCNLCDCYPVSIFSLHDFTAQLALRGWLSPVLPIMPFTIHAAHSLEAHDGSMLACLPHTRFRYQDGLACPLQPLTGMTSSNGLLTWAPRSANCNI